MVVFTVLALTVAQALSVNLLRGNMVKGGRKRLLKGIAAPL
jgi:hypothetical protein